MDGLRGYDEWKTTEPRRYECDTCGSYPCQCCHDCGDFPCTCVFEEEDGDVR